jgi:two-component system NtrC family response regulator
LEDKKVLLIVEDDLGLQKQLKWSFESYHTVIAGNRSEAITALRRFVPSVITLDLGLPPDAANASEGLKTLQEILKLAPSSKIIVVTGNDDRDNAIRAVAMGAYDFYQKPIDTDILNLIIERAFQLNELENEHQLLQKKTTEPLVGLIASCKKMQDLCRTIEKISPTNATVLLMGESGTGKEVLAKAMHRLSDRSNQAFVAVNCAAIPENLLESELFGYEKGAYTGAVKQKKGKIEYANKGTLFLDEIGDLPILLQSKLLRFLQERTIERIGGRQEIPIDVRIICATHQNLEAQINKGKFRLDLYYRISEIVIEIPPLRDRDGDAIVIAIALLKKYCVMHNKKIKSFSLDALATIDAYSWPGNIRELENKIKRAVILSDDTNITLKDLELEKNTDNPIQVNLKEVRESAEIIAIKNALIHSNNNVSNTAKLLGVTRPTLYSLIEKYGLKINE